MSLTNEQLILLDNLIYLDNSVIQNNVSVKSVVNNLLQMDNKEFKEVVTDSQFYYCKDMVNGMNPEQWKSVLETIKSDDYLMNHKITNVVDDNDYDTYDDMTETGFRAAWIIDRKDI